VEGLGDHGAVHDARTWWCWVCGRNFAAGMSGDSPRPG
jgi:hypothetical protein